MASVKKLKAHPDLQPSRARWIGVLDIHGFESWEEDQILPEKGEILNGLGTLHNNFCEEIIQSHYIYTAFVKEDQASDEPNPYPSCCPSR